MRYIRWRLLTAMIAMVVVTIALSGVFTRRVTHEEVLRLKKGDAAGKLWDGVLLVSGTPGFFELKRSRDIGPIFD